MSRPVAPEDVTAQAALLASIRALRDAKAYHDSEAARYAKVLAALSPISIEPNGPKPRLTVQEAGRLGGVKGGLARAANLTPDQRSQIAKQAAEVRWRGPHKLGPLQEKVMRTLAAASGPLMPQDIARRIGTASKPNAVHQVLWSMLRRTQGPPFILSTEGKYSLTAEGKARLASTRAPLFRDPTPALPVARKPNRVKLGHRGPGPLSLATMKLLRKMGRPMTIKQIADALDHPKLQVRSALSSVTRNPNPVFRRVRRGVYDLSKAGQRWLDRKLWEDQHPQEPSTLEGPQTVGGEVATP
jgi:hypothetical protein